MEHLFEKIQIDPRLHEVVVKMNPCETPSDETKLKMTELIMEKFNVKGFYLYWHGEKLRALEELQDDHLVVDCGHGVTNVYSIVEGDKNAGYASSNVAGEAVTKYLIKLESD